MSIIGATEVKKKLIGMIHLLREIPGLSAYEIAVKNGFRGTEAEWLASLKGEKGEKGDTGTLESHTEVNALGHRVINVAEPVEDTDAVNKAYASGNFITENDANSVYTIAENLAIHTEKCGQGDVVNMVIHFTMQDINKVNPFYGNNALCYLLDGFMPMPLKIGSGEDLVPSLPYIGDSGIIPLRGYMVNNLGNICGTVDLYITTDGCIKLGGYYNGSEYDAYHEYQCEKIITAFTCICK